MGFVLRPLRPLGTYQNFRTGALSALNRELRSSTIASSDDKVDKNADWFGHQAKNEDTGILTQIFRQSCGQLY